MKPFNESLFVIEWSGESPNTILLSGWDTVLESIATDTGMSVETVAQTFVDLDDWLHHQDDGDTRLSFFRAEYVYCCDLRVTRVLQEQAGTIQGEGER